MILIIRILQKPLSPTTADTANRQRPSLIARGFALGRVAKLALFCYT